MHPLFDLPRKKDLSGPESGVFKDHTYYLVRVAYTKSNPVHQAILGVGFLDKHGEPASYSQFFSISYDAPVPFDINKIYFLEVEKELCSVIL